jgi:hypothetical protein
MGTCQGWHDGLIQGLQLRVIRIYCGTVQRSSLMRPLDKTHAIILHVPGSADAHHLLVRCWRRIAAGRLYCPSIAADFAEACGQQAGEVLATFQVFLAALGYASRTTLQFGHPGDPGLTDDERRVLALIAVAQSSQPWRLDAHLSALARSDARLTLAIGTAALAEALCAHDLVIEDAGEASTTWH